MRRLAACLLVLAALSTGCASGAEQVGVLAFDLPGGPGSRLRVITDSGEVQPVSQEFGIDAARLSADYATQIVVVASATGSTGCPAKAAGVRLERAAQVAEVAVERPTDNCKADAVTKTFGWSIPRSDLPKGELAFRLTVNGSQPSEVGEVKVVVWPVLE
ncbi:hypothetical protein [Allorhizocola rhizosphaerae]|uniref:hypothetical protein n=1 Tax=Allorhizocola rhizosphaerae TaxID=1872709 RepID=UPI000E3B8DE1|nr:hypothetical protein [Allorhizocola rhizosphaerae]